MIQAKHRMRSRSKHEEAQILETKKKETYFIEEKKENKKRWFQTKNEKIKKKTKN